MRRDFVTRGVYGICNSFTKDLVTKPHAIAVPFLYELFDNPNTPSKYEIIYGKMIYV